MSVDYSVFDSFCKIPTWNTTHPLDERRFMQALGQVVGDPDFSAEAMGQHIREHCTDPMWGISDGEMDTTIERLVRDAEAVQAFVNRDRR